MASAENKIRTLIKRLLQREDGVSAVEWGVLASSIAAVVVITIGGIGQNLDGLYQRAVAVLSQFL